MGRGEEGQWMAVEVNGHRQHAGIVRDVQRFGFGAGKIARGVAEDHGGPELPSGTVPFR